MNRRDSRLWGFVLILSRQMLNSTTVNAVYAWVARKPSKSLLCHKYNPVKNEGIL